ncbi:MAG: NAD(+) diphosphatase [Caldilineaceae bacterium]
MLDLQTATFVSTVDAPEQSAPERAYWFLFQGDKLIVRSGPYMGEVLQANSVDELGIVPIRTQYLGYLEDAQGSRLQCFSGEIDPEAIIPSGMTAQGLRELGAQLGDLVFGLAGRAVQIVNWDRRHQYCGQCGTPTETLEHERAKRCPNCGLIAYPRLSPAIIIAVTRQIEGENRILLARNHRFPPGRYSVVAGFVEPGESLEDTARREVFEEVGIRIRNIRYFGSQPWPFPNSLMLGLTAEYESGDIVVEEEEIADAGWFSAHDLPHLPPKISIARKLIDAFVADNGGGPAQEW